MRIPFPGLRGRALDLLFPRTCGVCGAAGDFLCAKCRRSLPEAAPPRCRRCWSIGVYSGSCADCVHSPLDGARAPYVFEGPARTLVHQLKYEGMRALAEPMGELLVISLLENPMTIDLVVPVPLHGLRRRRRGFNQSELLARTVAYRTGLQLETSALRRRRGTPPQVQESERPRRESNVQGAFRCSDAVAGRRILLIDDVLTTGATARECARTLKAAGAASVWALCFCHDD